MSAIKCYTNNNCAPMILKINQQATQMARKDYRILSYAIREVAYCTLADMHTSGNPYNHDCF